MFNNDMSCEMETSADEHVPQSPIHLEFKVVFPHWKCADNALWCMYEKKCAFACVWVGMVSAPSSRLLRLADCETQI